jgi:hypothetical protein
MMRQLIASVAICLLLLPPPSGAAMGQTQDEFRPGETWPDDHGVHINAHGGGVLLHNGVYYWFGEHKTEGRGGNSARVGVHVYSSRDLYHWKDEGLALRVSDDPASDITRGCILERPKVIFNPGTRKFVMWFHLELRGHGYLSARSGVAVADAPTGPYQFLRSFRPDANVWPMDATDEQKKPLTDEEQAQLAAIRFQGGPVPKFSADLLFRRDFAGGQMARDMTLFVDDDSKAYQIYASEENGTLHVSQLSDDFLSSAGKYARVLPGEFNEAPAMFKHSGKYFLIASGTTGWRPNAARLAVADSIWGPYTKLGNPCVGPLAEITFDGQSTFVLPLPGKADAFIFMADRWRPQNAIDGRYVWLPIHFRDDQPSIEWMDRWRWEDQFR